VPNDDTVVLRMSSIASGLILGSGSYKADSVFLSFLDMRLGKLEPRLGGELFAQYYTFLSMEWSVIGVTPGSSIVLTLI
jgi:hypothetical protein